MSQTLFIPAHSSVVAEHKARIMQGQEPFYWRDAKAAHELIEFFHPTAVVFAVTRREDGSYFVREHIQVGAGTAVEIAIDPEPMTVRQFFFLASVAAIAAAGLWLVGQATL